MKMFRSFSIVAGLAFLGNILGYVRDLALAANLGATAATDAYFAAFFLPNTLSLILLSNSVALAFLPVFIEHYRQNHDTAWQLANSLINVSLLGLVAVVALAALLSRYWMPLLFPGFDIATNDLAVRLSYILLPMMIFLGLSSLVATILNSFEHFTLPALVPTIGNLIAIVAILISPQVGGIVTIAIGVSLSAVAQLLIQLPSFFRLGGHYSLGISFRHPALVEVYRLAFPMIVFLLVAYAALAVERNLASNFSQGSVSVLNYALRIFSIPIAFFASSVGTVIYPRLSLKVVERDSEAFTRELLQAIGATTMFLLPLSIWLILNSRIVVNLLFGFGRFSAAEVTITAGVLSGYSVGMLANGITRILQRSFYAMKNMKISLWAELISFVFYVGIAIVLSRQLGLIGLGYARAAAFIIVLIISLWFLRRQNEVRFGWKVLVALLGRYLFAAGWATVVWGIALWAKSSYLATPGRFGDLFYLVLSATLGGAVFLLVAILMDTTEIQYLRTALAGKVGARV